MSKKSAFTVAGGLVAAILAIVVALSTLGLARTSSPASASTAGKPIVKTITKTITIHKKAPVPKTSSSGSSAPVTVITIHRPTTSGSTGSSGGYQDDGSEGDDHSGSGGDD